MGKTIIINEGQFKELVKAMTSKRYPIEPSKVLLVKKFMDDNFHKPEQPINQLGEDGKPTVINFVELIAPDGTVLKKMYKDDAVDYLIDEFQDIYADKDRRNKFLGQMMEDWYNNKIGLYGSLSVNHL